MYIIKYLEAGVTVCGICDMVGVAEANYYKWFQYAGDSRKADLYREFRDAVKKAEPKIELLYNPI
ncbi:transposase [Desulfobacterota bacterium AH_259_B03_O07]|nr:transposase [Desulfobacterota bacterium AH_259_B03_O07]